MKRALWMSIALSLLVLGCECGHDDDDGEHEGTTEGEGTTETEGEGETETPPAHATGPLGWTAVIESDGDHEEEDDAQYREHRLLMWRTGAATGERAEDMAELGHFSNWQGVFTLYVAGEETAAEEAPRPLTLFGIRGTCEANATRALHLRVAYAPHNGDDEERLYDALEFEGCDGPFPYGAEGPIAYEELSTRTMTTPPAEVLAVVQPHEDEVTEEVGDEPMRIVGREIPAFHVWVLGGWENYVVRGSDIVWQSEDGVVASVTIGARSLLLVRGSDGPVLMVPTDDDLERVDPDAAPETTTTEAAE